MAATTNYQIVCVDSVPSASGLHEHIVGVGTGTDPSAADAKWTVTEVRTALDGDTRFYTVSPSTGAQARVFKFDCFCGYKTIRSHSDAVTDNNLDNMRACNWKS
jgi:hypothetical protein